MLPGLGAGSERGRRDGGGQQWATEEAETEAKALDSQRQTDLVQPTWRTNTHSDGTGHSAPRRPSSWGTLFFPLGTLACNSSVVMFVESNASGVNAQALGTLHDAPLSRPWNSALGGLRGV